MRPSRTKIERLAKAAQDQRPINGLTHCFYRYPARFSPQFVATAIECFSKPGDLVLDPYMGGGTTVVEAIARGRRAVGNDVNSLAAFVATVKTTILRPHERRAIQYWASTVIPSLACRSTRDEIAHVVDASKKKNLTLPRARFISMIIANALTAIQELPTKHARNFAKCVLLRAGQWALDGRKSQTSVSEFRSRLVADTTAMLDSLSELADRIGHRAGAPMTPPFISNVDAAALDSLPVFSTMGERAQLIVTSPPYPGIHVLYHRWQVDGRRETPAPYWITGCEDGQPSSYYNFCDQRQGSDDRYFDVSLRTLRAARSVLAKGGVVIQLVAFARPSCQLPKYLRNMSDAGFAEASYGGRKRRIWRCVPNRRWHANHKGQTAAAREVVLVHVAV